MVRIFVYVAAAGCLLAAGPEEQRVDALFADYAKQGSPGCAVGVLQRGETALAKGYGYADLEQRIPITSRSRFYMASVSKQFTSMALLLAEQNGKLKLDDSIRKWVPELPAYADAIPIRRLLDHTAGFRDYLSLWAMRGFSNDSVLKEAPTLALIARQKGLNFAPGTDHLYSNTGYVLAAIALRRATGKPLEQFAAERIFGPLEMKATRFQADHEALVPDRAHGYHGSTASWKTVDVAFDVIGSGGMYSNIDDMMRWARNFEKPAVGGSLVTALQTPGKLTDGRPTPRGYALGLVEQNGTYSHSGGAAGYSTFLFRVPRKELTVVCLCNMGGTQAERLSRRVAAIYAGEEFPAPPAAETRANTSEPRTTGDTVALRGAYWSEELFTVWEFTHRDGRAVVLTDGGELRVDHRPQGRLAAGSYVIKPNADASAFELDDSRAKGIRFVRR